MPGRARRRSRLVVGEPARGRADAADDLRALVVELLELALQPLPRAVLGLVVVPALEVPQAVAVGPPGACPPLIELLELPSLDAVGRDGRHPRLLRQV